MKLKEIIGLFAVVADMNQNIEGFYTGLAHEVNNSAIQYPALRLVFPYQIVNSLSNSNDNDLISYEFKLNLLINTISIETSEFSYELNTNYNVQQNTLNEIDQPLVDENLLRAKSLSIIMQYVEGLRILESDNTFGYFVIESYDIDTSLERYANDVVTGCALTIRIRTNNEYMCESRENFDETVWF